MSDRNAGLPKIRQDPTDRGFVQDPYPFYARIRSLGDFVVWEDYGFAVATTHAAVHQVMKHPRLGRAVPDGRRAGPSPALATFEAIEAHSLLEIEPPNHTRIRRLVTSGFTGERLYPMAPAISTIADRLIDAFPDGPFDFIDAFARPLAAETIAVFLGVPAGDAATLQRWSNDMVAMYQARRDAGVERKAEAAARDFAAYARDRIAERRGTTGRGDLLCLLSKAEAEGLLTEDELVSTVILMLNAGHEATAHAMGNAVPLLTPHPDRHLALLPEQIAGTVEECLRFAPPLHLFTRHVYQPVDFGGVSFGPDDTVGCLLGSACRDDAVWPDGDHFDPFRVRRPHTAFGVGIHACVGASLARMELQIAPPVLFSRCPELRIVEPPRLADLYHFHGLERLTVAVR
jgi:unspecific monooxygenase